jgi:hypothetical protein
MEEVRRALDQVLRELRSFSQDREITVVREQAVASLACELARDAHFDEHLQAGGDRREREARDVTDLPPA